MAELSGRVALVTGAGRGIGRATALQLAEAGARVVVTSRTRNELEEVVAAISSAGGSAVAVECDVAERSQSLNLIEKAAQPFGPIDILVNNAGVGSSADPCPMAEFRDEFWDLTLEDAVRIALENSEVIRTLPLGGSGIVDALQSNADGATTVYNPALAIQHLYQTLDIDALTFGLSLEQSD